MSASLCQQSGWGYFRSGQRSSSVCATRAFNPGLTWQMDQQGRLVPGSTASLKQKQQRGNTEGDSKDVTWKPRKAKKSSTLMQSSKRASNDTQTERPCLNTWLSPSSVLTSTIVWGGLQGRYICQSRRRALTHKPVVCQAQLTCTSCDAVTLSYCFICIRLSTV